MKITKILSLSACVMLILILGACGGKNDYGLVEVEKEKEIVSLLDSKETKGVHYVYFGRPTCPECKIFQPKLEEVLDSKKIKVLYYNTDTFKESGMFFKTVSMFNVSSVPSLVRIENGKVQKVLLYEKDKSKIDSFMD
ncbi:thioredoxin family protein [Listeria booriae]|uniref:Thioredoxin family protein n=1 Tax=Listeria booriae TaxID=1552123 RepID=A0A7X1A6L8_9LIST|nr:thioredoxin family protein [Listeria booriae]MBC1574008.1 thioredoxin family protein [Listeria booriae]MBC2371436.1 thioredoxin family protein [Listeria booriae]MBC2675432.1 thioredoxin family protein [Listeria booriae]